MRQLRMTVTVLAAFGAVVATAQAENLQGGPMKNGDQCFKYSPGNGGREARFGSWGACPQAASTKPSAPARLLPSDQRGPDRQATGTR